MFNTPPEYNSAERNAATCDTAAREAAARNVPAYNTPARITPQNAGWIWLAINRRKHTTIQVSGEVWLGRGAVRHKAAPFWRTATSHIPSREACGWWPRFDYCPCARPGRQRINVHSRISKKLTTGTGPTHRSNCISFQPSTPSLHKQHPTTSTPQPLQFPKELVSRYRDHCHPTHSS